MNIELLEGWHDKNLEEVLGLCRDLVEDPDHPTVHRWKQAGGKVLGHFQVYFPEEIAHAAGMLPIKVRGGQVEARRADSHFGSYLCSILRSSLEMAMTGQLPLDIFVSHPICDAARNLAAVFGRNLPYPAQVLYLPQNPNSKAAAVYLSGEYKRLAGDLQQLTGREISDDDLRAALAIYNESRALIKELYAIKRETPWLISVDESYVLVAMAGLVQRQEYNRLLSRMLPQIRARQRRKTDKMRVVWEGGFCEQPPLDMLRMVGRSCDVLEDDLLIGLRFIPEPIPTEGDPWLNLAQAYLSTPSCSPVQYDGNKNKEALLLARISGCGAQAAIITAAKMCEPGLDEQVAFSHALDKAEVPYFVGEFEEKMTSFDQVQIQLETFAENLLFD